MTKLTVVTADNKIIIDGQRIKSDSFAFADNIHAIHWDGETGYIEYTDGTKNEPIDSQAEIQTYIDQFQAKYDEIETEALAAAELAENTVTIPASVTMRQARLALLGAGLLSSIQPAIDLMEEPAKSAAQIEWDYSSDVLRNKSFVNILAAQMGWTDEQLDDLFVAAKGL